MFNFTFYNPTKIIFGKDRICNVANEIPHDKRILLTYGHGSIKQNGVYDQIKLALKDRVVFEFGGIDPNPKVDQLLEALPIIKQNNINYLLAVGGGSVIDGTKFIAAAATFKGDPWEIVKYDPNCPLKFAPINTALPFGCVLTLPATGSEMNCGAVISAKTGNAFDKLCFGNELLYPQFSILDPTATYSLPPKQAANGIIDTFVHVTEQYLTYPVNAAVQDRFAEGILATLIEEGPKVFLDPLNYDARANLMWCATCAGNGFINFGVPDDGATHYLGHELTARFNLDHGVSLAIILPTLLNFKRVQKREKLLQYAERVWKITIGSEDEKISQAISKTRKFFESLGAKTRLRDYNIEEKHISELISQLERRNLIALGEHKDIDLKQSEHIYSESI